MPTRQHLGLEDARTAAADELQHGVVGAEGEQLPGAAGDTAQLVPHVAEVQLLVRHRKVRLQTRL